MKDFAGHPMIGVSDDSNEFPWYAVVFHEAPKNSSIQASKSPLEVDGVDVKGIIPFTRLLVQLALNDGNSSMTPLKSLQSAFHPGLQSAFSRGLQSTLYILH